MTGRHLALFTAFCFIGMSAALGAEEDPAFPVGTPQEQKQAEVRFKSATMVQDDFAKSFRVGNQTFVMEQTTLADVIHALGRGRVKRNDGDASELEFRVDYTDGVHFIRFSSTAVMGGDNHELEGIEIRPLSKDGSEAGLPRLQVPISFSFGSVPMSLRALEKELGLSSVLQGFVTYRYVRKFRTHGLFYTRENVEVLSSLRAQVEGKTVTAVKLSRITPD